MSYYPKISEVKAYGLVAFIPRKERTAILQKLNSKQLLLEEAKKYKEIAVGWCAGENYNIYGISKLLRISEAQVLRTIVDIKAKREEDRLLTTIKECLNNGDSVEAVCKSLKIRKDTMEKYLAEIREEQRKDYKNEKIPRPNQ